MKNRTFWLVPIIGLLAITLSGCGLRVGAGSSEPTPEPTPTVTAPTEDEQEPEEDETLKPFDPRTETIPAEARCDSDEWLDYSVRAVEPGNPDKRQYGEAIAIPYDANTRLEADSEAQERRCGNPTELLQWYLEVSTWSDEIVTKDWLKEFLDKVDSASLASFVEVQDGKRIVTEDYQVYAAWMNAFVISRFSNEGKQSMLSAHYWMIGPFSPLDLPGVQLSPNPEDKDSWIYALRSKMGVCVKIIGVNPLGGELVVYDCPTPTEPTCEELGTCGGEPPCTNCGGEPPCTNCGGEPGKTGAVPSEPGEKPAPKPTTPPEKDPPVVNTPVNPYAPPVIETDTDLKDEGGDKPPTVVVTD